MPTNTPATLAMPEFPKTVADVVRLFRSTAQMTTREFAEVLGISANMVSLLENGRNEPDRQTIARWHTSEAELPHRLAEEIFIIRARQMFSNLRPSNAQRLGLAIN